MINCVICVDVLVSLPELLPDIPLVVALQRRGQFLSMQFVLSYCDPFFRPTRAFVQSSLMQSGRNAQDEMDNRRPIDRYYHYYSRQLEICKEMK